MIPPRNLEEMCNFIQVGHPSTGYITVLSVCVSVGSFELVIVWIVYIPSLYPHGVPVKGCVAVRTPHLRAPANLEDHGSTLRARLGVLLEKLDSLHIVRVACVLVTFYLIAFRTNVILANLTLPPSREKPSALVDRTLSHKDSLLFFIFGTSCGIPSIQYVVLQVLKIPYVTGNPVNLLLCLNYEPVDASTAYDSVGGILRLGQEALFPLKENGLPVLLELAIPENLCAGLVDNLASPELLAPHAVGIGRH